MAGKRIGKWLLTGVVALLLLYVLQVAAFELRLGIDQPQNQSTIVIATLGDAGERHERVVRLEEIEGAYYVAANHWPRAWYLQALAEPRIEVDFGSGFQPYTAVPVVGEEDTLLREEYSVSFSFRFRTGFPPRHFLRLDPRA